MSDCEKSLRTLETFGHEIEKEEAILAALRVDMDKMEQSRLDVADRIQNHEVVAGLLKDSGIKAQVVKKYLPVVMDQGVLPEFLWKKIKILKS